jgi:hypothetical protein
MIDAANAVPPSYLYHYTSLEGLRGIMRERRLWVTDIRFLNDSSELRQFFQTLRMVGDDPTRVLQSPKHVNELNVWRGADGQPDYRVWSTRVLDFMENLLSPEQDSSFMGVTCFSAVSDDLNQWRGYAPAQGVALRFDGARLQKWAIGNGYGLIKCKYGPPFEDEVAEVLLKIDQSLSVESPFYMSRYLFPAVLRIAAGCKNNTFSAEQEWRIISRPFGSFLELIPYSQEDI